ncbi:thiamine-phosphate kinase [Mycetocola manganoxydans]|uniref:Thiamine-monophosphate kinase n=1 Tax=Mycetocola manganoxydans TaxID=699879 RepID=A0A3L6ZJ96_9MICO|nr:thiamine-phosphate kinase [Mycetocola manganoxydans]RLP67943.1 thiamine-phosphate kinase [Mycetocola manganoxydans]GHD38543.1 thiamine-monophosphate kinase [Mycetocola manganoxydans]
MSERGENAETTEATDTVGDVHELAVLDRIFPLLPVSDSQLLGPGDDAAVLAAPDGRFVVTTDMMVHGPDFRLAWSTPHDLGWKAAASNLADVAAMGARPTGLLVAIAAPRGTAVRVLEGISMGLRDACARLAPGCGVVGGDMSVSDTLTLAITAFGDLEGRPPVLRSGARPGDILALAGDAGRAATGLRLLFEQAVDHNGVPDAAVAAELRDREPDLVGAQLAPSPPISSGVDAAVAGASAMLDVSDGLALDAARIARASGVRVDVFRGSLGENPEAALRGGEDHALLATFPPGTPLPDGFRVIGRVESGSGVTLDGQDVSGVLGWDPYVGWDGNAG